MASLTAAGGGVVKNEGNTGRLVPQFAQLVNTPTGRQLVLSPQPVIAPQGSATTGKNNIITKSQVYYQFYVLIELTILILMKLWVHNFIRIVNMITFIRKFFIVIEVVNVDVFKLFSCYFP